MKSSAFAVLLLLPLAAHANDRCEHSQPRNLQLDLAGVTAVVFDIGGNDLDVRASAGSIGKVDGQACASSAAGLQTMTLTQQREGGKLVVQARRDPRIGISIGNNYRYMKLQASVPDTLMVQLKVGSGDASIAGAHEASADIGSGDVKVMHIRGQFTAAVGSGDLVVEDVGGLHLLSIGSGDATIRQVRGASRIGSIGSGDLELSATRICRDRLDRFRRRRARRHRRQRRHRFDRFRRPRRQGRARRPDRALGR